MPVQDQVPPTSSTTPICILARFALPYEMRVMESTRGLQELRPTQPFSVMGDLPRLSIIYTEGGTSRLCNRHLRARDRSQRCRRRCLSFKVVLLKLNTSLFKGGIADNMVTISVLDKANQLRSSKPMNIKHTWETKYTPSVKVEVDLL